MNLEKVFRKDSFRSLIRFVLAHRMLRRGALNYVRKKIYAALVEKNVDGWLTPLQVDKYDLMVAMLCSVDRAVDRGNISKEVLGRLLELFLDKVLCNKEVREFEKQLGFYPPLFLTISPCKRCNLRCTGCYANSDGQADNKLDFDILDRILADKESLWSSHFTVMSGGEPFLWEDGGKNLLDLAALHRTSYFMVYTNGTLIDKEVARRLAELGNVTPAISLEGFEAETDQRRGKGVHRKVMQAFENLREAGVPFGISATATRHNCDVITSDEFVDFYFEQEGALYGWIFQYMPIGRKHSLDLMVTPEQRLRMFERTWRMVRERQIFIADFWNSGTASNGCICAGREGGYFYIDWDGNVTPCVFIPYSTHNIYDVYRSGGDLNTILRSPYFERIRSWQKEYGYVPHSRDVGNWLCPCAIRDHFDKLLETVTTCEAKPIDTEAEAALADAGYCSGMINYGRSFDRLTRDIWDGKYLQAPEADSQAPQQLGTVG